MNKTFEIFAYIAGAACWVVGFVFLAAYSDLWAICTGMILMILAYGLSWNAGHSTGKREERLEERKRRGQQPR